MGEANGQLQHALKTSVHLAYRRICSNSTGGDSTTNQPRTYTCGNASVDRIWVQGYVQPHPKRGVFSMADVPNAASQASPAMPDQSGSLCGLNLANGGVQGLSNAVATLDVFTKKVQPSGSSSEHWQGLGLNEGDYVLVIGKLRNGKKSSSQESNTPQGSRLGITAHKVLLLPGDAAAWHKMWMHEVQLLHGGLYAEASQLGESM
mmetsp:Transcript_27002/g.80059  ORF Transcript_27002/g.80059 Transcript_27002/m.80059 type:complete len:205 (-) Transcript_27002:1278-1892(-)